MDFDRIEGAARQTMGGAKEGFGSIVGDSSLQAEGKAEGLVGKVQNAVGGVKDTINNAVEASGVRKEDLNALGEDLAKLISGPIQARPLMFVAGAFILGWLFGTRRI